MAVTAAIKFTQGATTDLAGRALIGTLGGGAVVASNGDNSGVEVWTWEIVDVPPGSSVVTGVVALGDAPTTSFTPDMRGSYSVRLTVQDAAGNVATDLRVFSILETTGRLIPPFGAPSSALNYAGQARGWAKYMEEYLHAVDNGGSSPARVVQLSAGVFAVPLTTFQKTGGIAVDMSEFPATFGSKVRQVTFAVDVQKTAGATSVEVELLDEAHGVVVTGTDMTYAVDAAPHRLASGLLTVGAANGNIRNDAVTEYGVYVKMNGGGPSDVVTIYNATLVVAYV